MQLRKNLKLSLILGNADSKESNSKRYVKIAAILLLAIVILWMLWQVVHMELRIKQTEHTYRDTLYQKEQLVHEQAALKEELTFVKSDIYIREMARSKLGMLLPNEIMFVKR